MMNDNKKSNWTTRIMFITSLFLIILFLRNDGVFNSQKMEKIQIANTNEVHIDLTRYPKIKIIYKEITYTHLCSSFSFKSQIELCSEILNGKRIAGKNITFLAIREKNKKSQIGLILQGEFYDSQSNNHYNIKTSNQEIGEITQSDYRSMIIARILIFSIIIIAIFESYFNLKSKQ